MRSLISDKKILILIILLGVILRFYRLTNYPIQLNPDELTQLYDAISIAQTGKDIYKNFMPFIFPSVGDFKPPFYTYVTTLFYFLFGWSEWIIRLPGAIFSALLIPAIYMFALRLTKKRDIALIAAFFTAIAPFEIYFGRKSFENGAGILFSVLGFLLLYKYFENKKKRWLSTASIIFATGMYTYFSHAVVIPLLIISFVLIYRSHFSSRIIQYLLPIFIFLILVTPLILLILVNPGVRYRSQTVFIVQDRVLGNQTSLGKINNSPGNFLSVSKITADYIFNRYLKQFDPGYLFANGLDLTNQGLLGSGPLLLVQLPFLILGFIFLIRSETLKDERKFIVAWVLLGMLPSALTFEDHSPHRVVVVFTMLNIVSASGLYFFLRWLSQFRRYILYRLILIIIIGFNIAFFLQIYFINYSFEKSEFLQYPFKEVAQFMWSEYPNFDSIVFDPQFGDLAPMIGVGAHYYLAYYGKVPPSKFQNELHTGSKPRELVFDKFSIRQVYWPADKDQKNSLFVVSIWSVPLKDVDPKLVIKRFNFYNGKLAFYAIKL